MEDLASKRAKEYKNPKHIFTEYHQIICKTFIKYTNIKWDIFLKPKQTKEVLFQKQIEAKTNQRKVPIISLISKWRKEKYITPYIKVDHDTFHKWTKDYRWEKCWHWELSLMPGLLHMRWKTNTFYIKKSPPYLMKKDTCVAVGVTSSTEETVFYALAFQWRAWKGYFRRRGFSRWR